MSDNSPERSGVERVRLSGSQGYVDVNGSGGLEGCVRELGLDDKIISSCIDSYGSRGLGFGDDVVFMIIRELSQANALLADRCFKLEANRLS